MFLLGIVFASLVGFSNDSYLKLLTKENKVLISIINGTTSGGALFWKKFISLLCPLIITFVLCLNYYLSYLCYILVAYQSGLLTLTIFAMVSTYGVSGVLNVIFIIFPINIIYLCVLVLFSSVCLKRIKFSNKYKNWSFGIKEKEFVISCLSTFVAVILVCLLGTVVLPFFLKNAIFVIF